MAFTANQKLIHRPTGEVVTFIRGAKADGSAPTPNRQTRYGLFRTEAGREFPAMLRVFRPVDDVQEPVKRRQALDERVARLVAGLESGAPPSADWPTAEETEGIVLALVAKRGEVRIRDFQGLWPKGRQNVADANVGNALRRLQKSGALVKDGVGPKTVYRLATAIPESTSEKRTETLNSPTVEQLGKAVDMVAAEVLDVEAARLEARAKSEAERLMNLAKALRKLATALRKGLVTFPNT